MSQISRLIASNPSSAWDRISRRQCQAGAKRLGLKVSPGAKHSEMVALFLGQGITPDQVVNFVPVVTKTPEGDKVEMYPEHKERVFDEQKEHRRMEEFERRIQAGIEADKKEKEAQNTDIAGLKKDIDELKSVLAQFINSQIDAVTLQSNPTITTTDVVAGGAVDLNKVHWKTFQKMAKEAGLEWKPKEPREPIIEKLNG